MHIFQLNLRTCEVPIYILRGSPCSYPYLAHGVSLDDFGPITFSQPNLPHRVAVVGNNRRREHYACQILLKRWEMTEVGR